MITTFFRSSSLNTLDDFCEQKFFLTYVLGFTEDTNLKTEHGTCCHAVFECLGMAKKKFQETQADEVIIEHPATGTVLVNRNDWMKPYYLSDAEVDTINVSRINKQVYQWDVKLPYGHIFYGKELVDQITSLCYKYYSERSKHEWKNIDKKTIWNYVWILLSYKNGSHDPRNLDIIQTESPFEFDIDKPWAKYSYDLPDGRTIEGNLALKGTMDLTTREPGILRATDYKTGARLNWGTMKVKDLAELKKDKQLMLYYYALRKLYPNEPKIILTIFFIRAGGPFDLEFDDSTVDFMEKYLQRQFEYTKNAKIPKMYDPKQKDMKCTKFCSYYKRELDGTNFCKAIHERIKTQGMNQVLSDFMDVKKLGYYQSPGE